VDPLPRAAFRALKPAHLLRYSVARSLARASHLDRFERPDTRDRQQHSPMRKRSPPEGKSPPPLPVMVESFTIALGSAARPLPPLFVTRREEANAEA
jgi:hypothetical protein